MTKKKAATCEIRKDKKGNIIVNESLAFKVLSVVDKGLSHGLGIREPGQMCVEAAVAYASGEEHNDQPTCVDETLALEKIALNDANGWTNGKSRARGLRRVAIAQLGSAERFDYDKYHRHFRDLGEAVAEKHNLTLLEKARKEYINDLQVVIKEAKAWIEYLERAMKDGKKVKDIEDLEMNLSGPRGFYFDTDNYTSDLIAFEPGSDLASDYAEFLYHHGGTKRTKESCLCEAAEEVVTVLKKQKIPGTKYLYLTEQAA
jgi:hypothetical protein